MCTVHTYVHILCIVCTVCIVCTYVHTYIHYIVYCVYCECTTPIKFTIQFNEQLNILTRTALIVRSVHNELCADIHTYTRKHVHTYTRTHVHMYTHTRRHVHMYTHTHVHKSQLMVIFIKLHTFTLSSRDYTEYCRNNYLTCWMLEFVKFFLNLDR